MVGNAVKYELIQGDVIAVLKTLPAESVQVCVTSPPYWNLRDYGVAGQIGLEPTLSEYVDKMVEVFAEVRRVLRNDGTLWLNIGDSYAGGGGYFPDAPSNQGKSLQSRGNAKGERNIKGMRSMAGLKPKDLCMVPARVALALQADGYYLRSEIIWAKRAPMPESVTDRPTSAHEKIFLLSKSATYYYDADAVREPAQERKFRGAEFKTKDRGCINGKNTYAPGQSGYGKHENGRNIRNVWELSPEPFAEAHFATFPTIIPKRAILAGTSEQGCCPTCGAGWVRVVEKQEAERRNSERRTPGGQTPNHIARYKGDAACQVDTIGWQPSCDCGRPDVTPCTVLDPFAGSGTSLAVALSLGRRAIGIELNPEYVCLAHRRIAPYAAQELLPL